MKKTLSKQEIIARMAEVSGQTKGDTREAIDSLIVVIEDAMAVEERVQLSGFGTFEVRHRKARNGRNPSTGEDLFIEASKAPCFKAGSRLKKITNQEEA